MPTCRAFAVSAILLAGRLKAFRFSSRPMEARRSVSRARLTACRDSGGHRQAALSDLAIFRVEAFTASRRAFLATARSLWGRATALRDCRRFAGRRLGWSASAI